MATNLVGNFKEFEKKSGGGGFAVGGAKRF